MSAEKIKAALAELHAEHQQPHLLPWIVAYSAGKDSTLLLQPLLNFRDWLSAFGNDLNNRQIERRNGEIRIMDNGNLMHGPFTLQARQEILNRLLAAQQEVGRTLITDAEINLCKRIWAEDVVNMVRRLPVIRG